MGRIDEALRRSRLGGPGEPARPAVGPDAGVFDSAWVFGEGRGGEVAPAVVSAGSTLREMPTGNMHGLGTFNRDWLPKLVISQQRDCVLVEQFRSLAATLHQAQIQHGISVLLVTSAEPGEGKSLTSINLALTLSESYRQRVLLIDADLRRPSLHDIAQVPNVVGLGETLRASGEFKLPVYRISDTLLLAPAGRPDADPMSALTSPRMKHLLQEGRSCFDWVLLDAPPLAPIVDSSLLAPLADAALLVVRARRTHYATVQKAVDSLGRERIAGVVLNDADIDEASPYGHYYQAHASSSTSRKD